MIFKKLFSKIKKTNDKDELYEINKISNNLKQYFDIDVFRILTFNGYMADEKDWNYIINNFINLEKNNYFQTITYYDNPGNTKNIFNGGENLINFFIIIKAFFDSLDNKQQIKYEHIFNCFFIYEDKINNKKYFKIQKDSYFNSIIKKIVNYKNDKINKIDINIYNSINDYSDDFLICYKFFYEKLVTLTNIKKEEIIKYLFNDNNQCINIVKYAQNETFKSLNSYTDYNACVGTNGFNNITSYIDGYKEAVNSIFKSSKYKVDILVYPLCFLARHCIELSLKKLATTFQIILDIKKIQLPYDLQQVLINTHDLSVLYEKIVNITQLCDERLLNNISKLNEYITDFTQVDPKAETFRYPYNKANEHSLDNLSHINLIQFNKRFNEAFDYLENCNNESIYIAHEYSTGTFYKNYNRTTIENISFDLPDRSTWKKIAFDTIRDNLITKYKINSKRDFTQIVNIIQKHPQFASNIGVDIKITNLTKNIFDLYTLFALNGDIEDTAPSTRQIINKLFSEEDLLILITFKDMADPNYYSEDFSHVYENNKKLNLDINFYIPNLFYCPDHKYKLINKGIKKCGQLYLL